MGHEESEKMVVFIWTTPRKKVTCALWLLSVSSEWMPGAVSREYQVFEERGFDGCAPWTNLEETMSCEFAFLYPTKRTERARSYEIPPSVI